MLYFIKTNFIGQHVFADEKPVQSDNPLQIISTIHLWCSQIWTHKVVYQIRYVQALNCVYTRLQKRCHLKGISHKRWDPNSFNGQSSYNNFICIISDLLFSFFMITKTVLKNTACSTCNSFLLSSVVGATSGRDSGVLEFYYRRISCGKTMPAVTGQAIKNIIQSLSWRPTPLTKKAQRTLGTRLRIFLGCSLCNRCKIS